jgi:hypothetical protein
MGLFSKRNGSCGSNACGTGNSFQNERYSHREERQERREERRYGYNQGNCNPYEGTTLPQRQVYCSSSPIQSCGQGQDLTKVNSPFSTELLMNNGNIKLNKDGTIDFSAQAFKTDETITFSHISKGQIYSAPLDSQITRGFNSPMNRALNGDYKLESKVSNQDGALKRNVYLKVGSNVERFLIYVDNQPYVINRTEIEKYAAGNKALEVPPPKPDAERPNKPTTPPSEKLESSKKDEKTPDARKAEDKPVPSPDKESETKKPSIWERVKDRYLGGREKAIQVGSEEEATNVAKDHAKIPANIRADEFTVAASKGQVDYYVTGDKTVIAHNKESGALSAYQPDASGKYKFSYPSNAADPESLKSHINSHPAAKVEVAVDFPSVPEVFPRVPTAPTTVKLDQIGSGEVATALFDSVESHKNVEGIDYYSTNDNSVLAYDKSQGKIGVYKLDNTTSTFTQQDAYTIADENLNGIFASYGNLRGTNVVPNVPTAPTPDAPDTVATVPPVLKAEKEAQTMPLKEADKLLQSAVKERPEHGYIIGTVHDSTEAYLDNVKNPDNSKSSFYAPAKASGKADSILEFNDKDGGRFRQISINSDKTITITEWSPAKKSEMAAKITADLPKVPAAPKVSETTVPSAPVVSSNKELINEFIGKLGDKELKAGFYEDAKINTARGTNGNLDPAGKAFYAAGKETFIFARSLGSGDNMKGGYLAINDFSGDRISGVGKRGPAMLAAYRLATKDGEVTFGKWDKLQEGLQYFTVEGGVPLTKSMVRSDGSVLFSNANETKQLIIYPKVSADNMNKLTWESKNPNEKSNTKPAVPKAPTLSTESKTVPAVEKGNAVPKAPSVSESVNPGTNYATLRELIEKNEIPADIKVGFHQDDRIKLGDIEPVGLAITRDGKDAYIFAKSVGNGATAKSGYLILDRADGYHRNKVMLDAYQRATVDEKVTFNTWNDAPEGTSFFNHSFGIFTDLNIPMTRSLVKSDGSVIYSNKDGTKQVSFYVDNLKSGTGKMRWIEKPL